MKILVTGGCSFSECVGTWTDTWPRQLSNSLSNYQHVSVGIGSQGNGLISRKIIYQLTEILKNNDPADVLVGIMWSGPDRYDFYRENIKIDNIDGWMENPTAVVPDQKNWIILNHMWRNEFARSYYSTFYSAVGSLIYSYEHILRVQWFLKLHNIKYFMSTYTAEVFPAYKTNIEVTYLYDQIDFDQFLPVDGEFEWCRDYSGLAFPKNDNHPTSAQHAEFTQKVIVPFLQHKNYI